MVEIYQTSVSQGVDGDEIFWFPLFYVFYNGKRMRTCLSMNKAYQCAEELQKKDNHPFMLITRGPNANI